MTRYARLAATPAMLAVLSLGATSAIAAELPVTSSRSAIAADLAWDAGEGQTYEQYRRYRHDRRNDRRDDRHRDRDGVDAGDILSGVLILGGIAAIASAVEGDGRDERRSYPDADYRGVDYRGVDYRGQTTGGLDRAAQMCVARIEQDARVEGVESVDRDVSGWRVTGRLFDGAGFACTIDADGRIQNIDLGAGATGYGEGSYAAPVDDRQYDDESYRAAWADVEAQPPFPTSTDEPLPAYPGGPLPGELEEDEIGNEYPGGY
jgi:hypothetical protein